LQRDGAPVPWMSGTSANGFGIVGTIPDHSMTLVPLPQHMLGHRDSRRSRRHPSDVLVDWAYEHTQVDRRARPEAVADELGVTALLAVNSSALASIPPYWLALSGA
jgi:hypothetical protein